MNRRLLSSSRLPTIANLAVRGSRAKQLASRSGRIRSRRVPLPPPSNELTALVTGASAGLGTELARSLARRGYGVTLVARREEKLAELAEQLRDEHEIRAEAIGCDLSEAEARDELEARIVELGLAVEILVNNAGYGSGAPFVELDRDSETEMIRLNCEALVDLCGRFAPGMATRGRGGILNVASIASFQPMPRQATYGGTKALVRSFSEALHQEIKGDGVHVTALCPGPMKTEFIDVASMDAAVEGTPGFLFTDPADVAESGVRGLEDNKRIVLPSILDKAAAVGSSLTPHAALLPLFSRFYPVGK